VIDCFLTVVVAAVVAGVAIAIALLVPPVAEAAAEIDEGSVGDLLRANENKMLGFLLSFLVIDGRGLVPSRPDRLGGRPQPFHPRHLRSAGPGARPGHGDRFVLALAISLPFPATGYYPLLLLLLTDSITIALRPGLGSRRRPTHMGE
jgi:hypothetical protein